MKTKKKTKTWIYIRFNGKKKKKLVLKINKTKIHYQKPKINLLHIQISLILLTAQRWLKVLFSCLHELSVTCTDVYWQIRPRKG